MEIHCVITSLFASTLSSTEKICDGHNPKTAVFDIMEADIKYEGCTLVHLEPTNIDEIR